MFLPDEPGHLESHATFMWQLVDELERQLDCMVLKELGLKLELEKNPVDVVVIDHIERQPRIRSQSAGQRKKQGTFATKRA